VASIAHKARRAVQRFGVDVHPIRPDEAARRRAAILANAGVQLVIDGGANQGGYGHALRQAGYRGRIVSFEPVSQPFALLQQAAAADPLWDARNQALGDKPGTVTINVSDQGQVSSTLRPAAGEGYIGTEQVNVVTIDSLDLPDCALKLDLEGFEPQALDGAAATLPRVKVIEVEVGLLPPFKGVSYRAMLDRLEGEGFTLVSLEPGFTDWSTGRMYEADAILQRLT
jgi:FkbM family methyltransferase